MSSYNNEFNARNGALVGTSLDNYFQLLGATTGNTLSLNAIGSDSNISITVNPKGTGSAIFNGLLTANNGISAYSALNLTGSTGSTTSLGTSATTGTTTIGGTSQTGTILIGQSTTSQTLNLGTGATASGSTKTINIGTNGVAGSTTNIAIGSSSGTSSIVVSTKMTFTSTTGRVAIDTDAGGSFNFGRVDGTASTPYIDFNTGATLVDYDTRIMASGGNGTVGSGTLEINTGTLNLAIAAIASGTTKTLNIGTGGASGSTTTITIGSANGSGTTTAYGNWTFNNNTVISGVSSGSMLSLTNSGTGEALTVSGNVTIGSSTAAQTLNFGTGATLTSTTKAMNFGTNGVSGSTTNIFLGSSVQGARGKTIANQGMQLGSNSTPLYQTKLDFGSDVAGTWRKLAAISLGTGTYVSSGFKIDIVDPNTNHATVGSINADKYTYYVACIRTHDTTQDTPDACYISGPASHIRAVKISTGEYEIQVSNEQQWQEYLISIQQYAESNGYTTDKFAFFDGSAAGSAGIATYTAAVGTATDWFQQGRFASSGSGDAVRITQTGTGNALVVEDSTNPDSTPFVIDNSGNVLIGTTTSGGYKLQVIGSFAATSKSFLIDHPTKDGMKLRYGSLESPYHGVRLTGEGIISSDTCKIDLPDYIKGLCRQADSQVQITNIKHGNTLWVDDIVVDENYFTIGCENTNNKEYKFFWSFTAIRKDIEDMVVEF